MPLHKSDLFAGILPCDPIDEQDAELFSGFLDLVDMTNRIRRQLGRPRKVAEWVSYGHLLLNTCFAGGEEGDSEMMEMRQCLLGMEESLVKNGPEIEADVFAAWAENTIQVRPSGGGFLSSGVCFCSLTPMRSIPARVVILLGMNQKDFPRREPNLDLDLRRRRGARQGDRSRAGESRQMFLEAILSARDYLFFTRVGRDIRLDTELAPSALLSLLTGEMDRLFGWTPEKYSWDHPLQPFSPDVFKVEGPAGGYSPSFHAGALALLEGKTDPDNETIEADYPDIVTLDELREFFRSPGACFLRHHLGAGVRWAPEAVADHEPLEPDPLSRWKAGNEMLRLLRDGHTMDHAEKVLLASGWLPVGADGKKLLGMVRESIEAIWPEIRDRLGSVEREEIEVPVESASVRGFVPSSVTERAEARFGRMRGRDVIDTWLRHVFWSATKDEVTSRQYFTDSPALVFPPMPPGDATRALDGLVEIYLEGLTKPLRFDPDGSWICATESKFREVWNWWRKREPHFDPRIKWLYTEGLLSRDNPPFVRTARRVFSEPKKRMRHG